MTEVHRAARQGAGPDLSLTRSLERSDIGQDLTADTDTTPTRSTEDTIMTDQGARSTEKEETPQETLQGEMKSQSRRSKLQKREELRLSSGIEKMSRQQRLSPCLLRRRHCEQEL